MAEKKDTRAADPIKRGVRRQNPVGTGLFVGLRLADTYLQHGILAHEFGSAIIRRLGGHVLPQDVAAVSATVLGRLGLSPYRLILLGMSTGAALKQVLYTVLIGNEERTPQLAVGVSMIESVADSINSLLFLCSSTSASMSGRFPQTPLLVGAALYVAGITTELLSELQRKKFKDDPANAGRAYTQGLFGLSRHVNYFGYTMWRAGYALAAGGWIWGSVVGASHGLDFVRRAIPSLDEYCQERYGEQWKQYKRRTPFMLIPYVY